jgi:tetratricopeptide (TPR) repeat protein
VPALTRIQRRACCTLLLLSSLAGCASQSQLAAGLAGLPPRAELTATPFYPQTEHQCGPAALATLLGAAGHAVEPAALAAEVYLPGREGALQPELAAAVRARGLLAYELGPELGEILAEVAAGRPVLILQRLGAGPWPGWHYAVVVGYDQHKGQLLLRSGTQDRLAMSAPRFKSTWQRGGSWALVALQPGTLPARPHLTRYMHSAAALEAAPDPAGAHASYQAAAGRWPGESMPRLGLGNVAAARGDWREAESWYRAVLEDDPAQAAALNNRAEALSRLGCADAARSSLQQGISSVMADDPLHAALEQTARELANQANATAACAQFAGR